MNKRTNLNTNKNLKAKSLRTLDQQPRDRDVAFKWVDDYFDMGTFKMQPISECFIERLARDLVIWADNENNPKQIRISQFIRSKKLTGDSYYKWVERFPILKRANQYALQAIADKRESGAAVRDYSDSVLRMMPMYDPEWKQVEAWRSSLKDQYTTGNVTINLPDITTNKQLE